MSDMELLRERVEEIRTDVKEIITQTSKIPVIELQIQHGTNTATAMEKRIDQLKTEIDTLNAHKNKLDGVIRTIHYISGLFTAVILYILKKIT